MFKIPIWGEINNKTIKIIIGKRYIIHTDCNIFEGTILECKNESFLIKTVDGGIAIDFGSITDINEI